MFSEPNRIQLKKLVSGQIVIFRANFSAPHPVKCLPYAYGSIHPLLKKYKTYTCFVRIAVQSA